MKKLLFVIPAALLFACGGNPEQKTESSQEKSSAKETKAQQSCTYVYDPSATSIVWEAYKYTERAAVGGKMDSVTVSNVPNAESALGVMENASFTVHTNSVNSNNSDRDMKIRKYFFGSLATPKEITGSIKSWDTGAKKATVGLNINGVSKDLVMDYEVSNDTRVKLSGSIDVTEWNAGGAIAKLNEICKELHTGSDGKSKLWPDFKLTVVTTLLKEDCM